LCLLSSAEGLSNEFQRILSSTSLSIHNKQNIGVNISKIDHYYTSNQKFEYLLWNIDCRQHRSSLRTVFYSGADAIIILIPEKRINQFRAYFNELNTRLPGITLIFCIVFENLSQQEFVSKYLNIEALNEKNFQINEISDYIEILDQLSEHFEKELQNTLIIDFISIHSLSVKGGTQDEGHEYYEPESDTLFSPPINKTLLLKYVKALDLDVKYNFDSIEVENEEFGIFKIDLNNSNVEYYPKKCEACRVKNCSMKIPYSICIELGGRNGWTNIKGFTQTDLLILTKILALKEGNEKNLPKTILNQFKKVNKCKKRKKRK
jgi:hypothetical protein